MKIFVAGATGVLGRRAVKLLVDAGHDVTAIARNDAKAAQVEALGATPARVDLFDAGDITDAVIGHDVVMNLATHIPSASKMAMRGAWKENDRIRTEGSKILVDAAIAAKASRYVQESIAFSYEDRGDVWIDEDVPLNVASNTASMQAAETSARRFTESGGVGVVLRFGLFYCADSKQTQQQISAARKGLSTFLGDPDAYMTPIHLDDAASAVVSALAAPGGTYNVVDDQPMRKIDADRAFAEALGRSKLRRVPQSLVKMGGGPATLLSRSQRVSNERFRKASGWEPRYPSIREGLQAVLGELAAAK